MSHRIFCWLLLLVLVGGCTTAPGSVKERDKPLSADKVEKVVREILARQFKVDPASIAMDKPIAEPPLKADDLDVLEVVMEIEERLGIVVSDAQLEQFSADKRDIHPARLTPNQLVSIVREAPKRAPTEGAK